MNKQFSQSLIDRAIRPAGRLTCMVAGTSHGRGGGGGANNGLINSYNDGIWDQSIIAAGYRYVTNVAVGGSNMEACYQSLVTNLPIFRPNVVFFDGPTNDLLTTMTDAQLTAVLQTAERCILMCLKYGALPVLGFTPPRNSYGTSIQTLLPLFMELCRYYNIPFFDFYSPLIDPTTGNYATGYNTDSTHLNGLGRDRVFQLYSSKVANLANALPGIYIAPYRNLSTLGLWWDMLRNGAFLYQSSPGVPNSWTISTTGSPASTYTVTDDATFPYIGKTFKYTKGASGLQNALAGSAGALAANHKLQLSGRLKASGLTPSTALGWTMALEPNNGTDQPSRLQNVKQNMDIAFSIEATFPNASTPGITFYASDVGAYELNNLTLWDKTAAAAIFTPGVQNIATVS